MTLVVDMNLSPRWVTYPSHHGMRAVHWSDVGDVRAPDEDILSWARDHRHAILTHDLDFARLLSMTRHSGPSVIQARTQDVTPETLGPLVLTALREHASDIESGALVTIEPKKLRIRLLPIDRR